MFRLSLLGTGLKLRPSQLGIRWVGRTTSRYTRAARGGGRQPLRRPSLVP